MFGILQWFSMVYQSLFFLSQFLISTSYYIFLLNKWDKVLVKVICQLILNYPMLGVRWFSVGIPIVGDQFSQVIHINLLLVFLVNKWAKILVHTISVFRMVLELLWRPKNSISGDLWILEINLKRSMTLETYHRKPITHFFQL